MVMKMRPNAPSKLSGKDRSQLADPFPAAITLSETGYTPDYVSLRGRITPTVITANVSHEALDKLEADPKVVSVAPGRAVRPVNPTD